MGKDELEEYYNIKIANSFEEIKEDIEFLEKYKFVDFYRNENVSC